MKRSGHQFAEAQVKPPPRARRSSTARQSRRRKKEAPGDDAGKKVTGRKRHIVVDTLGLLLAVVVHPAHIQDCGGVQLVLVPLRGRQPRLRVLGADAG